MRSLLAFMCAWLAGSAHAQTSGHLGVRLEVLPPALRVTVTSARVDFGQQHANAGRVVLDPATGEVSRKAAGHHQVGQVRLTGKTGTAYTIAVTVAPYLQSTQDRVAFGMRWARSSDCGTGAFEAIASALAVSGLLGQSGCSTLRFGGTIALDDAPEGSYEGRLEVRIAAL